MTMIRRLIDRFRWWLVPGDVLRVELDWTFFSEEVFPYSLIPLKRGTLVVFTDRAAGGYAAYMLGLSDAVVATTFAGTKVRVYPSDLKRLTPLRRYQPDLT